MCMFVCFARWYADVGRLRAWRALACVQELTHWLRILKVLRAELSSTALLDDMDDDDTPVAVGPLPGGSAGAGASGPPLTATGGGSGSAIDDDDDDDELSDVPLSTKSALGGAAQERNIEREREKGLCRCAGWRLTHMPPLRYRRPAAASGRERTADRGQDRVHGQAQPVGPVESAVVCAQG
jgi:hypothetical protein